MFDSIGTTINSPQRGQSTRAPALRVPMDSFLEQTGQEK
jgi:hypothetical protein